MRKNFDDVKSPEANNHSSAQSSQSNKVYIDMKTGKILDNVSANNLNNVSVKEFNPNDLFYLDISTQLKPRGNNESKNAMSATKTDGLLPMTLEQYTQYMKLKDKKEKAHLDAWAENPRNETLMIKLEQEALQILADAKVYLPFSGPSMEQVIEFSALLQAVGADAIKGINKGNQQAGVAPSLTVEAPSSQTTQSGTDSGGGTSAITSAQTQIDALKALLDQTNPIGGKLDTKIAPSLGLGLDATKETDDTRVITLRVNPKRGTLNPYRSYKNGLVNDIIDTLNLNTPEADEQIINDVLKFTRMRRGGKVSKSLKNRIRKNEITKLSNQQLQQRFESKLQLFIESRLSHLLTSSNPAEVTLAENIVKAMKLSFEKFVARRVMSDAQKVLQMDVVGSKT